MIPNQCHISLRTVFAAVCVSIIPAILDIFLKLLLNEFSLPFFSNMMDAVILLMILLIIVLSPIPIMNWYSDVIYSPFWITNLFASATSSSSSNTSENNSKTETTAIKPIAYILSLGIFFGFNNLFTYLANICDVPAFVSMFKSFVSPCLLFYSLLFGGEEQITNLKALAIFTYTLGLILVDFGEVSFRWNCFVLALIATLCASGKYFMMERIMHYQLPVLSLPLSSTLSDDGQLLEDGNAIIILDDFSTEEETDHLLLLSSPSAMDGLDAATDITMTTMDMNRDMGINTITHIDGNHEENAQQKQAIVAEMAMDNGSDTLSSIEMARVAIRTSSCSKRKDETEAEAENVNAQASADADADADADAICHDSSYSYSSSGNNGNATAFNLRTTTKIHPLLAFGYSLPIQILISLIACLIFEFADIFHNTQSVNYRAIRDAWFWGSRILVNIVSAVIFWAEFVLVGEFSALYFVVFGALRQITTLGLSVLILDYNLNTLGWIGYAVAVVAASMFQYSKSLQQQQPQPQPPHRSCSSSAQKKLRHHKRSS